MRAASEPAVWLEYMASSLASSAASVVVEAIGAKARMRATTTAEASRGEMLLAMSKGVVPLGTSRMEPSGSWILIMSLTAIRIEQLTGVAVGSPWPSRRIVQLPTKS